MNETSVPLVRIGELSSRVGVSPELLRAWERRYGLLQPTRSEGGFRLYSPLDEARVRRMQLELSRGLSAAEAAVAAMASIEEQASLASGVAPAIDPLKSDLAQALDLFDDGRAQACLDRLFGGFSIEAALREVILPYLHELGVRWANGEATVAQEHFASHLIRGRLLGLARGWDQGRGPRAVLACPPGELHDLGLICFGLALFRQGWRMTFLGSDTPVETIQGAARSLPADIIVVSASDGVRFSSSAEALRELAGAAPLGLAGAGASPRLARDIGGYYLGEDPISAARRISHGNLSGNQEPFLTLFDSPSPPTA